jgi:hypothetical protein
LAYHVVAKKASTVGRPANSLYSLNSVEKRRNNSQVPAIGTGPSTSS